MSTEMHVERLGKYYECMVNNTDVFTHILKHKKHNLLQVKIKL